jgi:hypothetical protein
MSREMKAAAYSAGQSSVAGKFKSSDETEAFDGVLTVDDNEFVRAWECMTNRGEPTAGARRGAELLEKLSRKR